MKEIAHSSNTDFHPNPHKTYRCYIIWGRKKTVVVLPLFMILAGFGKYFHLPYAIRVLIYVGVGESYPFAMNHRQSGPTENTFTFRIRFNLSLTIILATNIILTLLSGKKMCNAYVTVSSISPPFPAGRIWWIYREVRKALGKNVSLKYNTLIAVM